MTFAERLRHPSRVEIGIGVGVLVLVAVLVVGLLVTSGKPNPKGALSPSATTVPVVAADRCPLTDLPAPGLVVPDRPALLVKIGNEPGPSRPQTGLNEADIVFDTPAEGFIMRYMAVYQCENAGTVGPIRSVRWVDYHLGREFIQPILAFAGGIDPNLNAVKSLHWLNSANLIGAASAAAYRSSARAAPDNLYTGTKALYGLFPHKTRPPKPVFSFTTSALPSGAKPVSSVGLDFSAGTDVVWKWQPGSHSWLHTYSGVTDVDALTGQPVTTTNIVVEIVHYILGGYAESTGGSGDIESQTTGTGKGYVLRGGQYIPVTWSRPNFISPTTFTAANGQSVGLAPGRTWVEIITDTQAARGIRFTP